MNIVQLTKEQVEAMDAINRVLGHIGGAFESKASVIEHKIKHNRFFADRKEAEEIPVEDFINALYYGYEVKLDPYEVITKRYEELIDMRTFGDYFDGKVDGMLETLNTLGIKVKGVNA